MKSLLAAGAAACLAVACSSMGGGGASGPKAVAKLDPTKGNEVRGTVTFTQKGDAVHVDTVLTGLSPGSQHGIHVHEKGDCSAPDVSNSPLACSPPVCSKTRWAARSASGRPASTERATVGPGPSGAHSSSMWSIEALPQTPQLDVA